MHRDVLSGRARISLWPHDGTISVYRNQELLKTIRAAVEVGRVESLAFSTDGKHLAVGTAPGAAYVWNIETGEEAVRLQSQDFPISCVRFMPNLPQLITVAGLVTRLWDLETGLSVATLQGRSDVTTMAESRSSVLLVTPNSLICQIPEGRVITFPRQRIAAWFPHIFQQVVSCPLSASWAASVGCDFYTLRLEGTLSTMIHPHHWIGPTRVCPRNPIRTRGRTPRIAARLPPHRGKGDVEM